MNKQLLREWITLDYTQDMIKESKEKNGGKIVIPAVLQKAGVKNQNERVYPRDILEREVKNYEKVVREARALGELDHPDCVPPYNFIMTSKGWMPIEEVKKGDSIATLDIDTDEIVYQNVERKIDQKYKGDMIRVFNKKGTLDMTLTPNHRMLLWNRNGKPYYITAEDFEHAWKKGDSHVSRSYTKRSGKWKGIDHDTVRLPGTDFVVDAGKWAAFLGIYLAEGFADGTKRGYKNSNCVSICQKKKETINEIRDLLNSMGMYEFTNINESDCGFSFSLGDGFHDYFFKLGNSKSKYIPDDVLNWSPRLLSILLDWMLKGDGKNRKGYKRKKDEYQPIVKEYATVSKRLAEDVSEVMIKLGYGSTINSYQPKDRNSPDPGRIILEENSEKINIVYGHVSKTISMDFRFVNVERVKYDDNVYCVTVPNGNWLCRSQSGKTFWTGNSSTVALDRASHIVREVFWDGDVVRGQVEVLTTPKGKILESLLESGVRVGISSRGVGSTAKNESDGTDLVQDDYQLICFDAVSEPSTPGAFMNESVEFDARKTFTKADRIWRSLNDILMR